MTIREQALVAGAAAAIVLGAATVWYLRADTAPKVEFEETPTEEAATTVDTAIIEPDPPAPPTQAVGAIEVPVLVSPPVSAPAMEVPQEVAVSIAGAVATPGFYRMDPDDRVEDLIEAADGLLPGADLSDINRSARLIDGTTQTIPEGTHAIVDGNSIRARGASRVRNPFAYTMAGSNFAAPQTAAATPVPSAASSTPVPTATPANGKIDLNTATQAQLEELPGIGPALAQRIISGRPYARVEDLTQVPGIADKRYSAVEDLITVGQ